MLFFCIRLPFILALICTTIIVLALWSSFLDEDSLKPYARCNNCHCIPVDGRCPVEQKPFLDYSVDTLNLLEYQSPINPFNLTCDPFQDVNCRTNPQQTYVGDKTAVCGIRYIYPDNPETCPNTYKLRSYKSAQAAFLDEVSAITHVGHCGVCSTTRDLAALIRTPDMVTATKMCLKKGRGVVRNSKSLACIRNLGFSNDCAQLWHDYTRKSMRECFGKCFFSDLADRDFNDQQDCKLNKCLACQKKEAQARFERIAGRTHARSGLLSSVVESCDIIPRIHHNPCPVEPSK